MRSPNTRHLSLFLLLALAGAASALPANYTSVLVYDEQTGLLINDTNITIANSTASNSFNSRSAFYDYYTDATSSSSTTNGYVILRNTSTQDLIHQTNYTFYCDYGGQTCTTKTTYFYADGTTATSAETNVGGVGSQMITYLNPNLLLIVNNTVIYGSAGSGVTKRIVTNSIYAFNKVTMLQATARGASTITASSAGYQARKYLATLTENTTLNQTAYLLAVGDATANSFQVISNSRAKLSNAMIIAKRNLNNTWQTVSEEQTDDSGYALMYLKLGEQYQFTATKTGYTTATATLIITGETKIFILQSPLNVDFTHMFDNLAYEMLPKYNRVYGRLNETINWTVASTDSQLSSYTLLVTLANGTVLSNLSGSNANGGVLSANMNLTGYPYNQKILAMASFTKNGYPIFWLNRSLYIDNRTAGNSTLSMILPRIGGENALGELPQTIVAVTVVLLIAGNLAGMIGGLGAGMIGLGVLGMFTLAGWLSGTLFAALILTVLGLYLLRSGA